MTPVKPTHEELEDMACVHRVYKPWRHGHIITEVYKRSEDDTFWMVSYACSIDGETNDFADGKCEINEVEPYEVVSTAYKLVGRS